MQKYTNQPPNPVRYGCWVSSVLKEDVKRSSLFRRVGGKATPQAEQLSCDERWGVPQFEQYMGLTAENVSQLNRNVNCNPEFCI
jgi:hypothetical protein